MFIFICLTLGSIIVFARFTTPNHQRTNLCHSTKLLTQIKVSNYNFNGVKLRDGTFTKKVTLDTQRELKIIIFPQALASSTWSKLPDSSIQYLGKGGDNTWQERLRPDYFYLLTVPSKATGLAFGRLCYRNGDVEVESIKKLKTLSAKKIIVNHKIYVDISSQLPQNYANTVIVNTGSNKLDTLGTQTEVYFTTEKLHIPLKSVK
jgi:hypothetical protein